MGEIWDIHDRAIVVLPSMEGKYDQADGDASQCAPAVAALCSDHGGAQERLAAACVMSPSLERLTRRAVRCMLDVLEAVGLNGSSSFDEVVIKSGYDQWVVGRAVKLLRDKDCIARLGVKHPLYALTERGKIALAIWHGRQHRARQPNQWQHGYD